MVSSAFPPHGSCSLTLNVFSPVACGSLAIDVSSSVSTTIFLHLHLPEVRLLRCWKSARAPRGALQRARSIHIAQPGAGRAQGSILRRMGSRLICLLSFLSKCGLPLEGLALPPGST